MATYYLPSESGWLEDHGSPCHLRLKIEQSYDGATNKSTLTVTPQARSEYVGVTFMLLDNAVLTAGGVTLLAAQSQAGTGDSGYRFQGTENGWASMTTTGGTVKSFSTSVTHNASGAASVAVLMHGRLINADWGINLAFTDNESATLHLQNTRNYTLTISAGTGTGVTVKRGGTALSNGATVSYGEQLTVTFAAVPPLLITMAPPLFRKVSVAFPFCATWKAAESQTVVSLADAPAEMMKVPPSTLSQVVSS